MFDIAFTPAVKALQEKHGSRAAYARMEATSGTRAGITPDLAEFIGTIDSFFLGSASADGQPYIQHRGGPPGFLRVLGPRTLGIADYAGNRQYISAGNLTENPKAFIFLIDYFEQRRIKLWGTARIVEDDVELVTRLMPENYAAQPERAIVFDILAWDENCPQHIPQR